MLYGHEYAAGFALGDVGHDVFDCKAHDVNWCILHEVVVFVQVLAEYRPCCGAVSIFREKKGKRNLLCRRGSCHLCNTEGDVWILV